ncbi:hypothetical protein BV20DRAFT_1037540 [Pilatotrama ljubarskyi]|nr:hypothetical protein BV20DRAFT_1037540 [Pilatotrama ljubarskyi]
MPKFTGSYARRELWMRGILRASMAESLVSLSGDANASMRWTVKGYHQKIYTEYGLQLVGWPTDLPFADLSKPGLTGYDRISRLYILWQSQDLKFIPVPLEKAARAAQNPMAVAPSALNHGIPPKLGRSDLKRHRAGGKVDPVRFPPRYVRNGPKSEKWVTDEAEARAAAASVAAVCRGEDPDDPIESFTDDELRDQSLRQLLHRGFFRVGLDPQLL